MNVFQGIVLGIVQGLTEFLPISSSGHLVLIQKLFGIKEGVLTFNVAVHFATVIAVIWIFREDILNMIKKPFSKLTLLVVVGTIPTAAIGFLFKDMFERISQSGKTLGIGFILTGVILWLAESIRSKNKGAEKTTYIDAAMVGVAQGIAILPAISRSGLTLAGALLMGLNREFALKFSFLMSIPPILGAALLDLKDIAEPGSTALASIGVWPLIAGIVAAGVSGYVAIRFMLRIFSKVSLKVFSYYVFALGILIILEQLISGKIFPPLF
ncbi:undecaprenyl-diphosphatase [Anaerobacterium chartisolvens]|uniref:Undecaprenyl-diphosphatase n=1 Tax=Anaerobacterium chartisolvens TaxID=1297424 RepID=A0A369AI94_9FIRM|nr:undecaprenyl-diphosphate phosphatase [Anaerobacterium chartisolvens]RCX09070.1 undecaprenyl-diphosphatase [Anaerobacterium chartisolvens]